MKKSLPLYISIGFVVAMVVVFVITSASPPVLPDDDSVPYIIYERQYQVTLFFLIFSAVTTISSVALYLKQRSVNEIIYRQAITDELTQIHNRRSIFAILKQEMERAKRHNRPLSIVCFDIDHFKKINDTYGHQIGDRVLTLVTAIASEALRSEDSIGRIGGEEYLVILPETDIASAKLAAERLRRIIAQYDYSDIDAKINVTVSLGVTQYLGAEDRLEDAYQRTDDALYSAKADGRNQVKSKMH